MKFAALAVLTALAAVFVLWFSRDVAPPTVSASSETAESESIVDELDPMTAVAAVEADQERTQATSVEVVEQVAEIEATPEAEAGDLRVRVLDEAGEPLGDVPVAVFRLRTGSRSDRMQAVTDHGSGEAAFTDAAARFAREAESYPGSTYEVGLHVPGLDIEGVPIDPLALPVETLELTMPDHGSLEVRIRDASGAPVTEHSHVFVTPLFQSPSEPGRMERGERYNVRADGRSEVSLPYAVTGQQMRVEVYDEGVLAGVHEDIVALRPGEHRVVTLVCRETLPHVIGRVVSADGQAIEARSLDVQFTPRGSTWVELGPKGAFVLPLSRLRAEADGRFSAALSVQLPGMEGNRRVGKVLSGRFDAVVPPPESPLDLGAIILREPAVFVSGTVVDGEGEPLEGAYVSLYMKFNQREDPEDFGWNFAGIDYVYSDAEGRFEVTVDRPVGEYAIRAHAEGFVDRGAVRF
ncbi:hypothetical protein Poly30_04650 [Planctomycetes bacterium Poly30]|uniref:Uncharacterized protein n=1 Tax=Saltatorellus ferox TaxID=2528018 RepID=A0A518ELK5_9BACT|nr:hypothetical protein Poly30_04650 [Planctomycetes bacterium Poly30]